MLQIELAREQRAKAEVKLPANVVFPAYHADLPRPDVEDE
jgi:hypothetical protein